jgi:4-hydroxythreonine-4-phosphate dehydrogenase
MQQNVQKDRPIVGITIGDINGIGPEVLLKSLLDSRILKICVPVIYASSKLLNRFRKSMDIGDDFQIFTAKNIDDIHPKKINLINCWEEDFEPEPGKETIEGGKAALLSLEKATADLQTKKIDALVTAPVNKNNMQQENFSFPGHTEYLASKFNAEVLMTMVSEELEFRLAVCTGHIPLESVKKELTAEKISKCLNIFHQSLKNDFKISKPKIAILGLNPHAGENGLLGKEEEEIISPLIKKFKEQGMLVFGPYPADGFFGNQIQKKFDGVLSMYHDQGLIPFKTIAFDSGINFTAGLPVIRTSPDHGTAYDIAGKNIADESSFRHALFLASKLAKARNDG